MIKPLGSNVVIRQDAAEETTKAGLFLSKASVQKGNVGEVVAVGTDNGSGVKAGDKVSFNTYGPTEIEADGEEYLIASEKDVLAIIS